MVIFQDRPELLAPVFRIVDVPLPEKAAVEVLTPDALEIRTLERCVDSVLRVEPPNGDGFLLAIDTQGRRDPDKAASWTHYLSSTTAKHSLPTLLLVVSQDKKTADWAAGPFHTGVEGWATLSVHPLVLGPENAPVILDPDEAAQDLTLATFSAMTHRHDPTTPAALKALAYAMGTASPESARYHSELLEIGLGETPARDIWRNQMTVGTYFPGRGTLIEQTFLEGQAHGEAAGLAEGVLRILEHRGISVRPETRRRISECAYRDTLRHWLDRAFTVSQADELLDELFVEEEPGR
ncbi:MULTISPECIES: hypothetical protein [Streptomyces]|uniref:hypothetical protein n=1 Tax=Streptomyces TaxID=1883 RepID=UPI00209F3457|nr:hypothetical protein [Streptomyces sp. RKCA744]MCO8308532.1 hypothetical protein [Streptomyces sp. RKCA744]